MKFHFQIQVEIYDVSNSTRLRAGKIWKERKGPSLPVLIKSGKRKRSFWTRKPRRARSRKVGLFETLENFNRCQNIYKLHPEFVFSPLTNFKTFIN